MKVKKNFTSIIPVDDIFTHKTMPKLEAPFDLGTGGQMVISAPKLTDPTLQVLSFAQQRLWFIEQYTGGSSAHNIPMVYKLRRGVNIKYLERALQGLVHRHQVMRSRILMNKEGQGYQQVTDSLTHPLQIDRLTVSSDQALERELSKAAQYIFRLEEEHPLRVCVYDVGDLSYLSIVVHHIAFDGWSIEILVRELLGLYRYEESQVSGDQDRIGAYEPVNLLFQYKDFAYWQRGYVSGDVLSAQLGYWEQELSGYESLQLPLDKPRPSEVSYAGSDVHFELDTITSSGLRGVARKLGVSMYSLLLSGYYNLLRAYSHQDDIVVGCAVANRHYPGSEDLIGLFVNTLVLRAKIDQTEDIASFIQSVEHTVERAQLHQDLPFAQLVDLIGVNHDASRHPIFQVFFNMDESGSNLLPQQDELFEPYSPGVFYSPAKYDLCMTLDDTMDQIRGCLNYATSLFDQTTIEGYIETYKYILKQLSQISADDRVGLQSLRYLDSEMEEEQVVTWNATERDYPKDKTLHVLFEEQALRTPGHIALVYEDTELTYGELNARANRLAHYLIARHGIKAGDLVMLCLDRSEHMLISILGVLKAGGAYVPMDPGYPEERISYMLEDTGSSVVLTNAKYTGLLSELAGGTEIIAVDGEVQQSLMEDYSVTAPAASADPSDLCYVIYTSGMTGEPRGVMVEHRNVVNLLEGLKEVYGFTDASRISAYVSYVADVSVSEFFVALLYGNELHLLSDSLRMNVDALSDYVLSHKLHYLYLPPRVLWSFPRKSYPSLRMILYAGEPCDFQTGMYWSEQKHLHNLYGSTEVTIFASGKQIIEGDVYLIGRPISNMSAYILDGNRHLLPVGAVGELYVGGSGVSRGYLNRPELTSERFISNPFQTEAERSKGYNGRLYKTGDLVRYLPDGDIEYMGQNDFQVMIRGYRIELEEIELHLSCYPGISQSVVQALEQATGDKYLVGYYVSGDALDEESIQSYLSGMLPDYMVPSALIRLDSIPLTVNGKLDRIALPRPDFRGFSDYQGTVNEF